MGWLWNKREPLLDAEEGKLALASVYQDGRRAMDVAMAMYLLPDLRRAIAKANIQNDKFADRIINLPCTPWDIQQVLTSQSDALKQFLGESDLKVYSDALSANAYTTDRMLQEKILKSTEIIILDDEDSDKSLVYGIAVSLLTKRVYLVFRGSVTVRDFLQDAKMHMVYGDNPAHKIDSNLPRSIGIHSGFQEYLYDASDSRNLSKFEIITAKLQSVLLQHPNYSLYLGGHSLGGALATIMALEVACIDKIPKPVTVIPTASPKVGNKAFLSSFEDLEKKGYLRCLQLANDRDVVTLSPSASAFFSLFAFFCQHRLYRHVGLRLTLTPKSYSWSYPPKVRSFLAVGWVDTLLVARNWCYLVFVYPVLLVMGVLCCCCSKRGTLAEEHSCVTYLERFDRHQTELERITIEDLYDARDKRPWWRTSSLPRKL